MATKNVKLMIAKFIKTILKMKQKVKFTKRTWKMHLRTRKHDITITKKILKMPIATKRSKINWCWQGWIKMSESLKLSDFLLELFGYFYLGFWPNEGMIQKRLTVCDRHTSETKQQSFKNYESTLCSGQSKTLQWAVRCKTLELHNMSTCATI